MTRFTVACCVAALLATGLVRAGEEKKTGAKVKEPELRKELLERKQRDQDARFELLKLFQKKGTVDGKPNNAPEFLAAVKKIQQKMERIDAQNREWLAGVIDRLGWPGKSLVGTDGAHAAWLLVQHADKDRDFQKRCLALMKKMPRGEVDAKEVAYLTDRVLVGDEKKQIYGTQLKVTETGEYVPQPIEDEANVDARRKQVGLPPLAEYLKQANKQIRGK